MLRTHEFVKKLKGMQIPNNTFLCSIDIDSFYTNIDTTLGLKAVAKAIQRSPDPPRLNKEIHQLLKITLTCNDFSFF